jgi:hypothetical protein
MTCSFRTRSDCHHDGIDWEITPLGREPHLDVIRGDHFDHSCCFEDRRTASECQLFTGQFELGQSCPESLGSRLSGTSSLSGRGQSEGDRIESRLDETGSGEQAQVVGTDGQQLAAPLASKTTDRHTLSLMHGSCGDITEKRFASSLQLNQALDLLGFAPELGCYPSPELSGEVVELLRLPCHLFRVLGGRRRSDRKVAASCFGAWGNREAG